MPRRSLKQPMPESRQPPGRDLIPESLPEDLRQELALRSRCRDRYTSPPWDSLEKIAKDEGVDLEEQLRPWSKKGKWKRTRREARDLLGYVDVHMKPPDPADPGAGLQNPLHPAPRFIDAKLEKNWLQYLEESRNRLEGTTGLLNLLLSELHARGVKYQEAKEKEPGSEGDILELIPPKDVSQILKLIRSADDVAFWQEAAIRNTMIRNQAQQPPALPPANEEEDPEE